MRCLESRVCSCAASQTSASPRHGPGANARVYWPMPGGSPEVSADGDVMNVNAQRPG